MLEIYINNKKFVFDKIITVLQACEQANIIIPRFCYHEKLSIAGSCRMCLVEIEKSPKPVASCAMPISNGMVIFTETPLVKKAQESVVELLLVNHPLDCPICDQGGECDLQDITINYGSERTRYFENKRGVEDKQCGPIIKTIMTRCIHCTRCVRFLAELAGTESLGSIGRGEAMEIGTYLNKHIKTELAGNLVDICPVGAITSKPQAFLTRSWELNTPKSTIDFSDAIGSNILVQFKGEDILRILPKINDNINETWISDKTRYSFDGIKKSRMTWKNIPITKIPLRIKNPWKLNFSSFICNIGPILSLEEIITFTTISRLLDNNSMYQVWISGKNYNLNINLPAFYQFNSKIKNIISSDLILLIGINPRNEAAILNLKLRSHFYSKNVPISLIGTFTDLTYPVTHLGNSLKTLLNIAEGKNSFCKLLLKTKNPVIIIGSEFSSRVDGLAIQNILRFLSKKSNILLKNSYQLNYVHSNLSLTNFFELGVKTSPTSNLYLNYKKNFESNYGFANFDGDFPLKNGINFKNPSISHYINVNTHLFNKNVSPFKWNIPLHSFFEKKGTHSNIEGFLQKSYNIIGNLFKKHIKPDNYNFILNTKKLDNQLYHDFFKNILKTIYLNEYNNKSLNLQIPFIESINQEIINDNIIYRKKFKINFLNITENSTKIFLTNLKPTINNFWMTDNISKNSKTMADCFLFSNDSTNFIKIS